MFHLRRCTKKLAKPFLSFRRNYQVSVVGGSSRLGQSISLLLKEHPLIHRLTIYDVPEETFGIAMDVSHIPREPFVEGWTGRMEFALRCSDIVVIACGEPRNADDTDYDLFRKNADCIICAMQEVAAHCPTAFVVIVSEPTNHIVPLASKVLECSDSYDKSKVFGVTGVDSMRIQTWLSGIYQLRPHLVSIPVICGHSSTTIVPLFSHIMPRFNIDDSTASFLTESVRKIESEVISLKGGCEQSTLSSAYATYCTTSAILNALNGSAIEHVAFVANNDYGTKYFAGPVIITAEGISAIMQYKVINELEANYIYQSTAHLSYDVYEGESYFKPGKDYPRHAKTDVGLKFIKTL